jgi:glycosyltransferase involved in cell wall biosynthesis
MRMKTQLPPVSYFIPAYNCAQTIVESVESLFHGNFLEGDELIITNDGSSDNTPEILIQLKEKYPFIQIYHNEWNKGGSATRNNCVRRASHGLIFCLDSDNLLIPESMIPLREHQVREQSDATYFQEQRYFSKNTETIDYIWKFRETTTLPDFLADHKNPGSSGNYLYTKESWIKAGGYPEFAGALDTWGFGLYQLATGAKMSGLPGSGYWHRYGGESYYIRDMNKKNMSLAALQVMLPYIHLIHPDDIDYIMSRKHRETWLDHLNERPLRTHTNQKGELAAHINPQMDKVKPGIIHRILMKLHRMIPIQY